LQRWRSNSSDSGADSDDEDDQKDHLSAAAASLEQLLNDEKIPVSVRAELAEDYRQLNAMQDKLRNGDLHIAVFGKVSAGKSSLLNTLMGDAVFSVSPLHGETRHSELKHWRTSEAGGVHLIDTPGINELDGESRERMAHDVASRSDLVIFVTDSDLTRTEIEALQRVAATHRPILIALNKTDRYSDEDKQTLLSAIRLHAMGLVKPEHVVAVAADPVAIKVIRTDASGKEHITMERPKPIIQPLIEVIWQVLEHEGKTLAALNASLFAGQLSDQVSERMIAARRDIATRVTRTYSLYKGLAVAVNPVPVADLLAAASLDVALVMRLSDVYGLSLTRREGSRLLLTIAAQMVALMGAVWGVHLASSALKGLTGGLSVTVTGLAQGALAYYATTLVGQSAEQYLRNGKSWGDGGPKQTVRKIVDSLDRDSILSDARDQILQHLRRPER